MTDLQDTVLDIRQCILSFIIGWLLGVGQLHTLIGDLVQL